MTARFVSLLRLIGLLILTAASLFVVAGCATGVQPATHTLAYPSTTASKADDWSAAIPAALTVAYRHVDYICAVDWSDRDIVPACSIGWRGVDTSAGEFVHLQTQPTPVPKSVESRFRRADRTCVARWSPRSDPIPVCVLGWIAREDAKFGRPPPPITQR